MLITIGAAAVREPGEGGKGALLYPTAGLVAAALILAVLIPGEGPLFPRRVGPAGMSRGRGLKRLMPPPRQKAFEQAAPRHILFVLLVLADAWIIAQLVGGTSSGRVLTLLFINLWAVIAVITWRVLRLREIVVLSLVGAAGAIELTLTADTGKVIGMSALFALIIVGPLRHRESARAVLVRVMAGVFVLNSTYVVSRVIFNEVYSASVIIAAATFIGAGVGWRYATKPVGFGRKAGAFVLGTTGVTVTAFVGLLAVALGTGWVDHEMSAAGFGREYNQADSNLPPTLAGSPGTQIQTAVPANRKRQLEALKDVVINYQPLWVFSVDERWRPTSAAGYLRGATIFENGRKTSWDALVKKASLAEGDDSVSPCFSHPQPLNNGESVRKSATACYATINCEEATACAEDRAGVPLRVYARVIENPLAREYAAGYEPGRPQRGLRRLIQYWTFYRYDEWRRWPRDGLHKWHEGDWEWVAIGLGDTKPLFVASSAHCGGNWRLWSRVNAVRAVVEDGILRQDRAGEAASHPLIYVAEGSHAGYPDRRGRPPNWWSCAGAEKSSWLPDGTRWEIITWGPSHALGITETTRFDETGIRRLGPPVTLVEPREGPPTDPEQLAPRLHMYWGTTSVLRQFWSGDLCSLQERKPPLKLCGRGPNSPAMKCAWHRPLHTIFCSKYWWPDDECPPKRARKPLPSVCGGSSDLPPEVDVLS